MSRLRPRAHPLALLTPTLALGVAAALTVGLLGGLSRSEGPVSTTPGTAAVRLVDASPNPVTPGNFTGFGFDQCLAPSQRAMNRWLTHSPFLAAGIYISGDSRACRSQPNLTPDWIRTQLRNGWKLLPITLGPQASCSDRYPRYGDDETINPAPGPHRQYGAARLQGKAEAAKTVREARRLGLTAGSTLWYDIEAFNTGLRDCRESALAFLSAWTTRLHQLDYASGVYSSVASGIKMLDDVRVHRPQAYTLPDMIWLARWDGVANTSSSYIRDDGWRPGARVKQYQGGHDETWGGVRINIDRNWLDVGKGSVAPKENHCDGTRIDLRAYPALDLGRASGDPVAALQCLLKERGYYDGRVDGRTRAATASAARAWQSDRGLTASDTWNRTHWISLLAQGDRQVLKFGSAGTGVRRLQRALLAAGLRVPRSGGFGASTQSAVRTYQQRVRVPVTGIVSSTTWKALARGRA